jgi:hypothetical protein
VPVGDGLAAIFKKFMDEHEERLEEWQMLWGMPYAGEPPMDLVIELRRRLYAFFGLQGDVSGAQAPCEAGIDGRLLGEALRRANDPETQVPKWLTSHVPLGIEERIEPSGIFPEVPESGVGPETHRDASLFEAAQGEYIPNYSSYGEHKDLADAELEREKKAGFLESRLTRAEIEALVGPC